MKRRIEGETLQFEGIQPTRKYPVRTRWSLEVTLANGDVAEVSAPCQLTPEEFDALMGALQTNRHAIVRDSTQGNW